MSVVAIHTITHYYHEGTSPYSYSTMTQRHTQTISYREDYSLSKKTITSTSPYSYSTMTQRHTQTISYREDYSLSKKTITSQWRVGCENSIDLAMPK